VKEGHTGGREDARKHPHHQAHPPVPMAWPEMARGGPATCGGSQACGISSGGALR
jgi:hypothetical protein